MNNSFQIQDLVSYPGHGVGRVIRIEEKQIQGQTKPFYVVEILANGLTVVVPVNRVQEVGLRALVTKPLVERAWTVLGLAEFALARQGWNQRYREFMEKIKSGDFLTLASVCREIHELRRRKDLSFGEKKMFDLAVTLLAEEMARVENQSEEELRTKILATLPA